MAEAKTEHCFTLEVDGQKYGPFLQKYRAQIKSLEHLKGVAVEDVWLERGWVKYEAQPPRARKDKSTPLLEGIGFIPVRK